MVKKLMYRFLKRSKKKILHDYMWCGTAMYKMSIRSTLISEVIVLLQLLHTGSSTPAEECLNEGEIVRFQCRVPAVAGILNWNGVGFDCPSNISYFTNNVISIPTTPCPLSFGFEHTGVCGPYSGSLTCTDDQEQLLSVLEFEANYEMNGGNISCLFRGGEIEILSVRVGVTPNPPSDVRVTFRQDQSCQFDWSPPNGTIGGIGGYNITYGENCGNCLPAPGITEEITAECIECKYMQCHFFGVNTVTENCGFHSALTTLTIISDNVFIPSDIQVVIDCSLDVDSPQIHVTWNFSPPEVDNTIIIPGVLGFLVTIYDNMTNNYSQYLNNSGIRAYIFNSTSPEFQNASLEGSIRFIIVTVETEVGTFSSISNLFSVEGTMADISSTLTTEQCIDVSINQQCNESADSFQAVIQFADGACEKSRTTETYTLQHDYRTCIPVGTDPICFSAVVFHNNGMEVARTGSQELILLQCNTSYISSVYNNGVTVTNSTTMEVVLQGTKVLHNTVLSFQCALLCKLMGTNTTRCVNGAFESLLNESSHCDCGPRTAVIAGAFVGLAVIIIIIIIICIVKIRDCLRACFPKKEEAKNKKLDPVEHIELHTFSDSL